MTCPSHPPWLDLSNYICRRALVMKLLIMPLSYNLLSVHLSSIQMFSSAPCYAVE
jgi:hypothetical protein